MRNITDKTFIKLLALLNFLNIYDAVMTSIWVTHYGATEINPLMDYLLSLGHPVFFSVKIVGVGLLSLWMWVDRNKNQTNLALLIGLVFYSCLTLYEVVLSILLLSSL